MLVNINKDLIKCLKLESHQHPMNLRTVKTESHVIFWKLRMKLLRLKRIQMERETENLVFTSPCWGLSHGVI